MQIAHARQNALGRFAQAIRRHWILYALALPVMLYYILFHYLPMFGVVIAFQDYRVTRGILRSDWVGLENFWDFFQSIYAWPTIRNTLSISVLGLIFGFPAPILLALLLNEVKQARFKKTVQTITYVPHFISLVVICSMVRDFCATRGLFNEILGLFGGGGVNWLTQPAWFYPIYIISGIWQNVGWDSIIYFAALTGIDQSLYEAAEIDGANRFKKIIHVTLPGISPTIVILLIMRIGNMMTLGWDKILLLYNPMVYEKADVISTYVYRIGLMNFEYSFAAAVGFFNSIINFVLLILANTVSRKVNETSLW